VNTEDGKDAKTGKEKGPCRVLKFRRKNAPTLEELMRNEAPTPDLEELLLMLRPGKRAAAELERYRRRHRN